MNRIPPALLIATASALAACTPADEDGPAQDEQQQAEEVLEASQPDDCLLMVWSNQEERDLDFDRANDLVDGGAISCATGTSPSQFEAALAALREAAKSGDRARLLEQVGIPLLYIDKDGERVELDQDQIEALFDEVFDDELMGLLGRLDLKDMTVAEQGGFFELGSVWLVVDKEGSKPRLVTVNRQALEEAAEAARRAAEDREGETVPIG